MENLSTHKRFVMSAIVVVSFVVVAALFMGGARSPDRPAGGQTVASTTKALDRKPAASISLPEMQLPDIVGRAPVMPDEIIERVLKKDKKLGLFMDYYRTVLPDEQTRDEYHKLLSDPAMMTTMAEDLMDPGSGHPEAEEYLHRLMQVDYFEAALTWKDNPQRQKALELTRDIISKDNFQSDQDSARRQVLGGSKMELYRLLYDQDVQKAGALVAQAKGSRMEPLINWMAEEELRRRALEKENLEEHERQARNN